MRSPNTAVLKPSAAAWPRSLTTRLGESAPSMLHLIGPAELLAGWKVALFCSARTPGAAILRAHDAARRMRDEDVTVISGFHSPIERECLKILLRGKQPIIICPGRAIETMRIPADCRAAFNAGRVLFLAPFTEQLRRVTKESALRRNEVVAALADEAYVAHIEGGGKTDQIVKKLTEWRVPIL
jgi:predicted Rossmann fold nucleotide-binding protein DprA/Smf involved in DNA uptake